MRQSVLFSKTIKETPKDETSFNAQALIRSGYIDKLFAGVYTYLPLGLRVITKIKKIIREEINAVDGQEILMPTLHPLENYRKTGRESVDVLFYTKLKNDSDLVLGQSHEEVVTPLLKKHIHSYKDLPQKIYQFQNKFRNELRAKSGIMRGREFLMKDLYSFHANQDDLDKYYQEVQGAYERIYQRVGIGDLTFFTYASGGSFSKYSHEYQTLTFAGEDVIYICDKCRVAINKEIITAQEHKCPQCGSDHLHQDKSVEVGNIFKLGSRFSKAFNFYYVDKEGQNQEVVMGCYGIGLGRLMGTVVEIHHDENGIVWPESIAPFKVHLLSLERSGHSKGDILFNELKSHGVDVLYDDRYESPAKKLKDADLIGIPVRVVVSDKNGDKFGFKLRNSQRTKEEMLNLEQLLDKVI